MRIINLAQAPELAETLARWHFAEWSELYPDWSFDNCLAELRTHTAENLIPTTLLAMEDDGALAGSVSLLHDDLPGYPSWSPWLASLYVRPDCRRHGFGALLMEAALDLARKLGVACLYLFTPAHAGYYAARGWSIVAPARCNRLPVKVMSRFTDVALPIHQGSRTNS